MFITDRFVFLHIPKTAGTFVHKVLRELHCSSPILRKLHSLHRETGIKIPLVRYSYKEVTKHATRRRIPEACDGSRPVVLAVRDPFDHYVSLFRFGWWRNFANRWFVDVPLVERTFGPLADFDFPRFVFATTQFARWKEGTVKGRRSLGPDSAEWLRYFCARPAVAVEKASDEELLAEVRMQMSDVCVLYMESINQDLKDFLVSAGIAEEKLRFLDQAKRVYPGKVTRSESDSWQSYYTPELRQTVRDSEWLLFELFPRYLDPTDFSDAATVARA